MQIINKYYLTWNTGRSYTEHGQRMAAATVSGGVIVVDYERTIEFYLPDCPLDRNEIMRRYDSNDRMEYRPQGIEIGEFLVIREWLKNEAKHQGKIEAKIV